MQRCPTRYKLSYRTFHFHIKDITNLNSTQYGPYTIISVTARRTAFLFLFSHQYFFRTCSFFLQLPLRDDNVNFLANVSGIKLYPTYLCFTPSTDIVVGWNMHFEFWQTYRSDEIWKNSIIPVKKI